MDDVDAGKIDVIVVYKIDRLSRSLIDFSIMLQKFDEKGILFSAVTQRISTIDAAGKMMVNIIMSFAQYEREIASKRIRDKYAAAKSKGKYCGSRPILGYDVNKERNKLIVNDEEKILVEHIFKRYVELKSTKKIAQELHEQGYRTKIWKTQKGKIHGGEVWNTGQIYRLLNNRTYIGKVYHKGNDYEGEHDAIIDQGLWDKAHAILMHNHANPGDAKRIKMSSALRGVIRCGHCNSAMATSFSNKTKNKRYVYYICTKDAKRAISTCPIQRIPANDIEQAVITQLSEVFKKPGIISGIFQEMKAMAEREIERFTRQRDGHVKTQSKIQDAPNSQNELARIAEDIYKVERQIQNANRNDISEEDITRSFQTMEIFWESLFPIEQRRLIELLVELVEIRETGLDLVLKTSGIESLIKDLAGIAHDVKQRGTLK